MPGGAAYSFPEKMPTQRRALWQGGCNGELVDWFPNTNERSLEIRKNHGGSFWERVITMNMCVLFCSLQIILPYLICFSQWAYQVWAASLESSFCRWEESASELQQPAQGHSSGKYQGQELKNRTAGSKFCAFFHWNILPVWSHDSLVNQSFRKKKKSFD